MAESTSDSDDQVMVGDKGNSEVEAEEVPVLVFKPSHEAKLRELLHNICSLEIKLCSDATKEFVKLLRGETGGELLCLYAQNSSKFTELLEAWKLRQEKQGLSDVFSLIYAILSHPEGKRTRNYITRAIDKFGRLLIEEKLDDIYKELNSKEGKRQNAALLLLASIVRRGPGLASDVAKKFDFKIQGFAKLAEHKTRGSDKIRKHSTRKAFVGFAISFLEVGKPGLLRWVIQQKGMYSGVLRGLGKDDDETLVYVLSTLKDRVLVEESLIPPGLRSVLFGSFTLEQLVSISAREDVGTVNELAHNVLLKVCTDPSNGLMPDPRRRLRGNPKRLLMLMKRLRATELGYHKDLLIAIVSGRPSLASAFLDEFPFNVEDYTSPTWFSSISLAANLVSSVGISCALNFLYSHPHDTPLSVGSNVQSIMKCICPRPFSRSVINKGLLHSDYLVKHGTLRFLLETLKLLDSFATALNHCSSSGIQVKQKWASLEQEIQNEVRNFLPDSQVLLTLLSSLGGWGGTRKPSLKRKADLENGLADRNKGLKKSKKNVSEERSDIIIGGIGSATDMFLPEDGETVVDTHMMDAVDAEKEFLRIVSEIWASELCSKPVNSLEDAEIHFHTKLLDALRIYMRTVHNVLEGSFDFFVNLLSNPSSLPADLQRALLSLLNEYVGWTTKCPSDRAPIRTPPLMYKHLHIFINSLLLSPHTEVKDLAYDLALAAMSSTGAFDRNPDEIGAWFLFLPGYGKNRLPSEVQEVIRSTSPVIISFLCDAVSTVGNNLFKHWEIIKSKASDFKNFKGLSIGFSPLIVGALQKCLRLLNSESKTYSLSEKSMISLYICNTVKYLLQTQVDAGLLSSLIQSILSEVLDDSKDSFCEWRPLRTLLLFSQTLLDKKPCCLLSGRKKAQPADSSFANTLDEVKNLVRGVCHDEIAGIVKAFSSALLCTTPDVILKSFAPVMNVSWALFGAPFSFLWSIAFLEENFLGYLSKQWPKMFLQGLEMAVSVNLHKVKAHGKSDTSEQSPDTEEIIFKMDIDDAESSAFSIFLNQAPFHILFPAIMSMDVSCLVESSKIAELLLVKISESKTDCIISYIRLILFWFGEIRSSYKVRPASVLCQLSEICLILVKHLFFKISELKLDSGPSSSNLVVSSATWKQEVAQTVFCNPIVVSALESPLSSCTVFEAQNFEISSAAFLSMCRGSISEIDHHVLDLLATTSDLLFDNRHVKWECGVNKSVAMAFKALIERLLLQLTVKFELCVGTENFIPLLQALYPVHVLLKFVSPFKLLHLARSMLSMVGVEALTIQNSSKILSVGFSIAAGAFEMLSLYLHQPAAKRQIYDLLWELKDNSYDYYLVEEIYGMACEFSTSSALDSADICLLKAVSAIFKGKHNQNHDVHPLTLVLSRIVVRTSKDIIFHCINRANMTRAKLLFYLVELSPLHLSVFGHLFLGELNKGQGDSAITDDQFLMLLPAALSYLSSALVKFEKKYNRSFVKITSVYSCILINGFLQWESFVSRYMFEEKHEEMLASTTEELDNLFNASLLGKAIRMLQYHFVLSESSTKVDLLKVFHSIFPCANACDEMLDYELKQLGFHSLDNMLNVVIRVVAKVSFLRMWLFPDDSGLCPLKSEADNYVKERSLEMGSTRESLSTWLMHILVNSWQCVVKKSTSVSDGSVKEKLEGKSDECQSLYKSLENFILRIIVEFAKNMRDELAQLESLPFLEKLMKSVLLYRFEDSVTLKRLREIFSLLSGGKFSRAPYLQLLISHSQFTPTISSHSRSSCSHTGELFRPVSSILKYLTIPHPNPSGVGRSDLEAAEQCMKQLETLKILRVLLCKCGEDVGINLRELHYLLLSSYGASLSEIDLEIYKLMHEIELIDGSHTINVAETGYLWGKAAIKIRKEQALDQDASDVANADSVEESQQIQFRENLCIDPKFCALTVLFFPHQRIVADESLNNIRKFDDAISEELSPVIGNMERYDPAFILHFSIHSLSMGYIEPVEFVSLGLLAVAFASMSSANLGMRKLGYETLGTFLNVFESCRRNKYVTRLRLLLTYMQNGIEEPWQRIPTVSAVFAAETSLILLDPSHEHYAALSKLLMHSSAVKLRGIPLFRNFFWSSAVNFRSQRLWELRLLYVGLNSDDDAQVYIRNSILTTLMSFFSCPVADNETKGLILQVVRKSVKLHRTARHLVENCSLLSWLSSIISMFTAKLTREEVTRLIVVLEVISDVLSSRNIVEWLQRHALEELMEISMRLYRVLGGGLVSTEENAMLIDSMLRVVSSTLKISQKRKMYQPHFTLSLEGIFRLCEAVSLCDTPPATSSAELGLRAILMSTPLVDIIYVDLEKLTSFLVWGTSTALKCDLKKRSKPNDSHQDTKTVTESQEETLVSKFLRWLSASVILGKLYSNVDDLDPKLSRKTDSETLQSLLECIEKRYHESRETSYSDKMLGAVIFYLQQLLSTNHRVLRSVVSALSFVLLHRKSGSEFSGEDREFIRSLCSRISIPPEANPSWRWSYYQPWRDLSSEPATHLQKINELHSCQHLLLILSEMLGEKPADSQVFSHKHPEIASVFEWERSYIKTE